MKERGINNTFKKIIYESSEMVFLADDTYPYNIFYTNVAFEKGLGQFLDDKTLVGLGLDINSYIFNEELIITYQEKEYVFNLELPQENGSNYFLFYKGKEIKTKGMPSKRETQLFLKNWNDIIGIGQENFLTWVSESVENVLGYTQDEVTNVELCQFFHAEDLPKAQELWLEVKNGNEISRFIARMLHKNGNYIWIDWQINFIEGKFYIIGKDVSEEQLSKSHHEWKFELFKLGEKISKSGVWDISLPGNQVYWSEELYRIFEIDQPTVFTLEQNLLFFLPEFRPVIQKAMTELMAIGNGFDLKLKIKTQKGNEKWVRMLGKAFLKENEVVKVYGTFQDISDSFNLLNELSLFKEMFELSPETILILDLEGNIIFTNQEAKEKLDFSFKDNYSPNIFDFDTKFKEKSTWQEHVLHLTEKKSRIYQSRLANAIGGEYEVEVNCNLTEIQGKKYIISFARDISDRIVLENSLKESSDFLLHLTEQVPGALYQFVLDKEGEMTFSYLSPGIKDLLGVEGDEFSGMKHIGQAINKVHPEDIAQVLTSTVASARKLKPWACQFRVIENITGGFKWVLGAAKPELMENGDVVWYGYLTDISEQKRFENNLKNAREQAERASQIKSEFLSMISHELRTPLNAISGSVYSLLQDDHSQVQASALNTINFAVDNLIIMINDLLDYQKIEAGKLTLENNPMNLKNVVGQVMNGLEFHAKDSRNKLTLHMLEELNIDVKGDKVRLAQVLNNLITNALKFTNNGKVDVTLRLKESNAGKAKVYFEVKDTGVGIAKEHQDRIFDQFDQIQHSFSKKYGGTGLGLSITKKLLEQMDSQIKIESEVGIGSTFFFEIEFEKISKTIPAESKPADLTDDRFNKIKLLMAEDNDVNALVLGKIIKKWGINYERVHNGQEAVHAVSQGKYDCVLMDIQMPVMDGFEATKIIKTISNVPVIALSAAAKQDLLEKIEECGFTGYVSKPIDAAELLKKIKEVLA
ncbi:PAS domain S-box-containing protein [Aquiflexum balticum DSM 16537]|uniref:histidine kinase n=1 Tax=Aquiflexum balticum DSM 16537 TaxID=758820 RepID=A0A1W2HAP4_9BACT|nr:PAS domain S-box protein [Aquiflexum balticum]SMD45802.1 PAS domain S-box-containing protein [Aquiflexum balticum DSM 16537]